MAGRAGGGKPSEVKPAQEHGQTYRGGEQHEGGHQVHRPGRRKAGRWAVEVGVVVALRVHAPSMPGRAVEDKPSAEAIEQAGGKESDQGDGAGHEQDGAQPGQFGQRAIDGFRVPARFGVVEPLVVAFQVHYPSIGGRVTVTLEMPGEVFDELAPQLDRLVSQFDLTSHIKRA